MSVWAGLAIFAGCILAIVALYVLWWYLFDYSKVKLVVNDQAPEEFKEMLNNCKVLLNGFRPTLVAPGRVSQTVGVALKRSRPSIKMNRELLQLDDGGQVGLDWFIMSPYDNTKFQRNVRDLGRCSITVPPPAEREEDRPIVVIVHGVNGGSNENYIRHFGHALELDPMMRGCRVVVMVSRGLCGVPMLTPRPYNAGYTEDLRTTINHIHQLNPNAPIMLAGFSLGANLVCRYVCEEKGHAPIIAALSVNNPFDLQGSTTDMESQGFVGRYFSSNIAKGLIRYTKKNEEAFKKSPYKLDFNAIYSAKLCSEFDEAGSCKMFGLAHNTDYYREYSSLPVFRQLANETETPTLFVCTRNDPMCTDKAREESMEIVRNAGAKARVALALSDNGGHLGFLESTNASDLFSFEHSWVDRVGCEYFSNCLNTYAPLKQ